MNVVKTTDYAKIFDRLCHFLALSKTVDLDAIVDNLVVSTLACDPDLRLISSVEICDATAAYFEIGLSESTARASLDRLLGLGRILRSNDGIHYLPPNVMAAVSDRVKEAYELQTHVRDEWLQEINGIHPSISSAEQDKLWNALRAYMARAFHRHGTQTIQLLDPRISVSAQVDERLSTLLSEAIEESDTTLPTEITRSVIREFFRNQTPDRVKYLAQLLDGTFSFFALTVDEATSKYLRGTFHPLAIFLDTNFIFGILGLHNNLLVDVSRELVSFIDHHDLPFALYYHPETLDEMRRTIYAIGDFLRERTWTSSISRAAVRNGQVSGLELRYHSLNAQTPTDPEAFLAVYEHPEPLLRDQGFVVSPELPTKDSDVEHKAKLVAEYKAFIESRRRPKPYAAYNHDMVVWMATQEMRGSPDSILESGSLFLTCDYHLYVFDQKVLRKEHHLGSVVMPNHFLQMLRPLVPSTDDFDRRFVETFSIPEFRTIGSDYAATVSKVLSYLASFSNIREETAVRILADELLVEKLRGVEEGSDEFKSSVENALAKENEELLEEIVAWKSQARQAKVEREKALAKARGAERDLQAKEAELQRSENAQKELQKRSQVVDENRKKTIARWRVAFGILVSATGLVILFGFPQIWQWPWLVNHPNRLGLYGCTACVVAAIGWTIADPKRRQLALGALGLGALFALFQILGK